MAASDDTLPEIDLIALAAAYVLFKDGTIVPVTTWFDSDGEVTEDPFEAVCCVAGSGDRWYTITIHDRDEVPRLN